MAKKTSTLFITQGVNDGASRFRVQQYFHYLRKEGYHFFYFPLHRGKKHPENYGLLKYFWYVSIVFFKFVSIFFAPFFKVIFIQRSTLKHISPFPERIIRFLNKNIIFDFDDAVWLNYLNQRKNPVAEVIKISKEIIAGNKFLSNYAAQYNKNITLIPTPVDTGVLKPVTAKIKHNYLVIGWTGSFPNYQYLYRLKPVLEKIKLRYKDKIEFKILSNRQLRENLGIKYNYIEWSPENENSVISSFDIGIMPLIDSEWTRGKCAFKVLQYMAAGAAVIASPVGMNKEVIKPGMGFLANNNQEWYEAFCQLIENSDLRNQLAREARMEVERKYSVKNNFEKFKIVIDRSAK